MDVEREPVIPPLEGAAQRAGRACDHPGCQAEGSYRAPKARDRLNDYYWFCLDHVRAYNRAWNYHAGLSDTEIEQSIRSDTIWQRQTRPFGGWQAREEYVRRKVAEEFAAEGAERDGREDWRRAERANRDGQRTANLSEEEKALDVLGLEAPVDLATAKARYKSLVKRHHPDANGGDREAEERLKTINRAYGVLKACLSA
jgi:hypothetical protein